MWIAGLDLGQVSDPSEIVILEYQRGPEGATYDARFIQRFPLKMSYPQQVARVCELLARPPLADETKLVIDGTGVGRAVVDIFRARLPRSVAVTITGGEKALSVPGGWSVPKRDLVGVIQVLLQSKRLRFAEDLAETKILTQELLSFEVKISELGKDTYGAWREGAHDDLVLALALGCWWGERGQGFMPSVSLTAPTMRSGWEPDWMRKPGTDPTAPARQALGDIFRRGF